MSPPVLIVVKNLLEGSQSGTVGCWVLEYSVATFLYTITSARCTETAFCVLCTRVAHMMCSQLESWFLASSRRVGM